MFDEMVERMVKEGKEKEMECGDECARSGHELECAGIEKVKEKEMANVKWKGSDVEWMVYVWEKGKKVVKGVGSKERCVRYCGKVRGARMVRKNG